MLPLQAGNDAVFPLAGDVVPSPVDQSPCGLMINTMSRLDASAFTTVTERATLLSCWTLRRGEEREKAVEILFMD